VSGQVRRTQTQRRIESERALLEATIDVIANEGVGSVTFEALGKAGGFSRGLASSRFGSKAKLIEAALDSLHERQEQALAEQDFDGRDGLDAILGYVNMALADMAARKEARAYFMLLSSSVAEASELRGFFAETHETVRARLEDWVRRGQRSGTIRSEIEPGSAALMIGCMLFGSAMQFLVDADADFEALRRSSIGLLRAGLSAGARGAD